MGAPKLELDWEEGLFRLLRGLWRRLTPTPGPVAGPGAAALEPLTRRLSIVASLAAGRPLRVLPAREAGGIRGADVLLPPVMDLAPDVEANAGVYVLRALVAGTMVREAHHPDEPVESLVARAVAHLSADLPGFRPAWEAALALAGPRAPALLWGGVFDIDFPPAGAPEPAPRKDGTTSEAEAGPVEEIRIHDLSKHEERPMPVHSFEKVEMAEPFSGTIRQLDGADDLDDHLEALAEVPLGDLLRGGPEANARLRADVGIDADVADVARVGDDEGYVTTDEWDPGAGTYRRAWCRVYPTAMPAGDESWAQAALAGHRRTTDRLYGELCRHRDRLRAAPRQLDGEDVDVDAMTDAWATVRAGHDPDPRLYVRQARHQRDLATTVLLDVSSSTDAWVGGRRVLDVARDSVLILGEVAERLGDRVEILAFASHTRHKVRVWRVRGWQDSWRVARGRLGRLEPQGYTRIGPALRYAAQGLARVEARTRLLLLVSDGKPTDYDRYEGRYGRADVRQAIREAGGLGVKVHALAIDTEARDWLPAMLGPGAWAVLPRPEDLPLALTRAWGRLG